MRAIELFCGIGGFGIALQRQGFEVVFANDISKKAGDVYQSRFPKHNFTSKDIREYDVLEIPSHDLLTAGFPCQPFSPAGKKLGIDDKINGTLFESIVKILKHHQPRHFVLENVNRMLTMQNGEHFKVILKALSLAGYNVEWRVINSLSFGIPQHRNRVFIIGSKKLGGGRPYSPLLYSKDQYSSLLDITDPQYHLNSLVKKASKFASWGMVADDKYCEENLPSVLQLDAPLLKLHSILQNADEVDPQYLMTESTEERLKDSVAVNRYHNGVEILFNQKGGARFGYSIFGINGYSSTLTASTSRHYERYKIGNEFRRLTNVEYARLMGFPDEWCCNISKYHQHKLFGNAVVPACVDWVLKQLPVSTQLKEPCLEAVI